MADEENGEFYLRYYVGHKGKFGHEFLEFEFRPDGKLRYANNSNYKNDTMIRKEVFLTPAVLKECRRIVADSEIMKEDDNNWPEPDRVGRQELEIVMGNEHISFTTSKIGSLMDVQSSKDPEGLRIFYYLVQVTTQQVFKQELGPSVDQTLVRREVEHVPLLPMALTLVSIYFRGKKALPERSQSSYCMDTRRTRGACQRQSHI
ncbi:unnamed protein product [Ilex paraguariensis]|uniref:Uncharacterized protein n=1 Tax=Ilex paraguariensis TaxID=185542 RepID=A0ABC8QRS1_9AQUA